MAAPASRECLAALTLLGVGKWSTDDQPTWADLLAIREPACGARRRSSYTLPNPRAISDDTLAFLRYTPNVVGLNLNSSSVTDAGMAAMRFVPLLEEIDLTNSRVGDVGILHLLEHRRLRWLSAMHAGVTYIGEQMLRLWLPDCNASIGRHVRPGKVVAFDGRHLTIECGGISFDIDVKYLRNDKFAELLRAPLGQKVVIRHGEGDEPNSLSHVCR